MPAGREMNIVSFTALRFGNLAIISAWTIEEMLSGKKATHRLDAAARPGPARFLAVPTFPR